MRNKWKIIESFNNYSTGTVKDIVVLNFKQIGSKKTEKLGYGIPLNQRCPECMYLLLSQMKPFPSAHAEDKTPSP
jgi:hypothetical protein